MQDVMTPASMARQICERIAAVFEDDHEGSKNPVDCMTVEIIAASQREARIFLYGLGREALMIRALAMRLFHLGLRVHMVFDVTTPPIGPNDLFIVASGPGTLRTVDALCEIARASGARVLLVTAQLESRTSTELADCVAYLSAQTLADDETTSAHSHHLETDTKDLLPMGSLFEGAMFVLFEMVVARLKDLLGASADSVRSRHANLE